MLTAVLVLGMMLCLVVGLVAGWLVRGGEDGFRWTRLADTAPGRDETEEE